MYFKGNYMNKRIVSEKYYSNYYSNYQQYGITFFLIHN